MVPKTLAKAIANWPSTDLAELLALIHTEIHRRAETDRKAAKKRPKHGGEKP
jgi:hypothetical protein